MRRLPLVGLLILCRLSTPLWADEPDFRLPTTMFLSAAAADKATTAYCFTDPRCQEATPGYAWIHREAGPVPMFAVTTAVDVATVLVATRSRWSRTHPTLSAAVLYGLAGMRATVAVQNWQHTRVLKGH